MYYLNVLTSELQERGKGGFWEIHGHYVVLIPFEELPSSSGLVQAVVQSPHLFHIHIFEGRERQFNHSWSIHR